MVDSKIYEDIAKRTGGDIYIGVVGPVRTGKSTFISKFMNLLVLPNMEDGSRKQRIIDEMPQSSDGKAIMTTQPKFVPDGGVRIKLTDSLETNVRLIDCVGYPYEEAQGFIEDGKERNIFTPWSEEEMPFSQAARLGTQKVMEDHSTIGVVVTNDGSILNMDREKFVKEEEQIIAKMKELNKPFVILLNTKNKDANKAKKIREELEQKYEMPVILENILAMDGEDFKELLNVVLQEFPIKYLDVSMPKYLQALPKESKLIVHIVDKIKGIANDLVKMSDYKKLNDLFIDDEDLESNNSFDIDYGKGKVTLLLNPKPELFYKVLSEETGQIIENEFKLVSYIKELAHAKEEYDKMKEALDNANEFGYGIMTPSINEIEYEEPEIMKKGNKCSIKMRANAYSYHIMKVGVETEVSPVVGGESQNEDMIRSWLDEYEDDYDLLWETNMLGKSLKTLAKEGVDNKVMNLPDDVRFKLRKTVSKIINEGKGGVICMLL